MDAVDALLPCEFCSDIFPESQLIEHQELCQFSVDDDSLPSCERGTPTNVGGSGNNRDDDDTFLPCDVCGVMLPLTVLASHQNSCASFGNQYPESSGSQEYDDPFLPCQICEELFPMSNLASHQDSCTNIGHLYIPDVAANACVTEIQVPEELYGPPPPSFQVYNMEAPEPLIVTDETGKMILNEEVARCLASVREPLTVVSIVGKYRTGKSYLLNRLMEKQTGFPLGSAVEAKTKGIWIWLRHHPHDPNRMILLMDTEGLADPDKSDQTHDTSIFALAVLLSSMFIYNSKGTIDNYAINELHFTTEMTEHIKIKTNGSQTEDDFDRVSPVFVWAIRDFFLKLEMEGKEISANEWLENCLSLKPGYSQAVIGANNVKKSIRGFFRERNCFTFPCPVDADKLQDLDTVLESELKEDFLIVGKEFSEFVFNFAPTKEIEGKEVNGRIFVHLLYCYLEAIRRGAIPCIESAVNYMAAVENSKAQEEAIIAYNAEMARLQFPVTEDELNRTNQAAQIKAIHVFNSTAIFDQNQDFQVALGKELVEQFNSYVKRNETESINVCKNVIKNLYERIKVKANDECGYLQPGGYAHYRSDMEHLKKEYMRKPRKGVKSYQVLNEFLKDKETEGQHILAADDKLTVAQRENEKEQLRRLQADMAVEEADEELARMMKHEEEMRDNYKHGMELYTKELNENTEKQIRNLRRAMENQQEEQERLLRMGFKREAGALNQRINSLQRDISNSEHAKQQMRDQFQQKLTDEMARANAAHQTQMTELTNRLRRSPPRSRGSSCLIM